MSPSIVLANGAAASTRIRTAIEFLRFELVNKPPTTNHRRRFAYGGFPLRHSMSNPPCFPMNVTQAVPQSCFPLRPLEPALSGAEGSSVANSA